jgi:hypothetical protein
MTDSTASPHINPLVFYQKPAIGSKVYDATPVQIVYPTGNFGIGIAASESAPTQPNPAEDLENSVLASGPEYTPADRKEISVLKLAFILLGVANIIITSLMFFDARMANPSNVVRDTAEVPRMYDRVSNHRSDAENAYYAFTILILLLGMVSSYFDHALGLSAYAIGIMLLFFLGTASLPYFIFAARYILDAFMLYFGLVQRSRLIFTFLPMSHLHGHGQ